eukprot:TRINITY_DN17017_c0_g1_i1.p2 TRINITY_DN17017_c0_g1~~TRINITY_DN17017_c0_g1_i1.p2  ORF type:complete len:520 (+),score=213.28 TRINITY_DN17017_c0_g1_i1:236-1795(+)
MPVEAFGLDLGNASMCMAVWQDDAATVVVNADGHRTTPAYIAFSEGEVVVGDTAKIIAVKRPREVVHSLLYVLAHADEPDMLRQMRLGYQLEVNDQNVVTGVTTQAGMDPDTPPRTTELSDAFVPLFKYAKGEVEAYVGNPMKTCVLTLPHYICDNPSAIVKVAKAAKEAGLEVTRVLRPSTASLIHTASGGRSQGGDGETHESSVVLDVGHASSTASLLLEKGGLVKIVAEEMVNTSGRDFTKLVFDYLAMEFKRKTRIDIADDARAKRKLIYESERCKKTLSSYPQGSVQIEALSEGADFNGNITSSRFEATATGLLQPLKDAVKKISSLPDIVPPTRIIIIGGGSNSGMVHNAAKGCGVGKVVKHQMPEEVAALGAAEQTAVCDLSGVGVPVGALWDRAGNGTAGKEVDPAGLRTEVNVLMKDIGLRSASGAVKVLAPASSLLPFEISVKLPLGGKTDVLLDLVESHDGEVVELAKLPLKSVEGDVTVTLSVETAKHFSLKAVDSKKTEAVIASDK